ncbi:MAG: hypothetical protein IKC03_06025 [Oscillospiraceae bacterium]|nr:hypothetical protein [Oscillospiraceae bacterium]
MEIIIRGEPNEIAVLVLATQGRQSEPYKIETSLDMKAITESALEAIRGMREAYSDGDSESAKQSGS